jgi:hypothetical protein
LLEGVIRPAPAHLIGNVNGVSVGNEELSPSRLAIRRRDEIRARLRRTVDHHNRVRVRDDFWDLILHVHLTGHVLQPVNARGIVLAPNEEHSLLRDVKPMVRILEAAEVLPLRMRIRNNAEQHHR